MKASAQRRRSKAQIKEEKKAEERKQKEIAQKLSEYEEMKQKLEQAEDLWKEKENYRQLCDSLYENGVIKQDVDGSIVAVEDVQEREQIRSKTKQRPQVQADGAVQGSMHMSEFDASILNQEGEEDKELT